jgi:membrane-associated phospholipid phosphatase
VPTSPIRPLLGALACFTGLVLTGAVALLNPLANWRDAVALQGFTGLYRPRLVELADPIASLADPEGYLLIGTALVVMALVRGRPRIAFAVPAIMLCASLTTMVLKPLVAQPRPDIAPLGGGPIADASWPSGHATAAMTLALCAVLAAPPRVRPTMAALGGVFAVAVSYSILVLGWHFPSDILGGFFVAATWTLLGLAALSAAARRWPVAARSAARPVATVDLFGPAAIVGALAGLAAAVVLLRPYDVALYAAENRTFLLGALAIPLLAAALAAAIARTLRQ